MAQERTNTAKLGGLQRFRDALNANSESLPHLEVSRVQYDSMVTEAQGLMSQQGALTAQKQDVSKQVRDSLLEAERLATVLRLAVKQHFGIRSEKLAEFNLQPFRGRKKPTPPNPAPPAEPTE
jgi:hypothetical protein